MILISISSLFIFIFSCSNDELSRSRAEKLIKEKFSLPSFETEYFVITDCSMLARSRYSSKLKILENEGVITSKYDGNVMSCAYAYLTEKGKQYQVGDEVKHDIRDNTYRIIVKVADVEFGEIKGIVERKQFNVAQVTYTLVRKKITPFGKIEFMLNEGTIEKSVTFTKYDDGWRIN